jgi:hypothetical protein
MTLDYTVPTLIPSAGYRKVVFGAFFSYLVLCPCSESFAKTYSTNFSLTENPIAESGNWTNGKAIGLDWADVQTVGGVASGTESGSGGYDDSTAILAGTWGPDQTAQATVHSVNQNSTIWEEVEIRLRSKITAHSNTGYEINFRCTHDGSQYIEIVRWNGPLGNFTYIVQLRGGPGIHDGDVVKAAIHGSTITVYINSVQILQGADSIYQSGNPGIGFYIQNGTSIQNRDFGFTSFSAADDGSTLLEAPSNARVSSLYRDLRPIYGACMGLQTLFWTPTACGDSHLEEGGASQFDPARLHSQLRSAGPDFSCWTAAAAVVQPTLGFGSNTRTASATIWGG